MTEHIDLEQLRDQADRARADAPHPDVAYVELHPDELAALITATEAAIATANAADQLSELGRYGENPKCIICFAPHGQHTDISIDDEADITAPCPLGQLTQALEPFTTT